ncbi:MAG TPA: DUF6694 family lipoprotein [Thermoanaerobaculia bacterium]|nr:DUF6694 family lipoprotein [Thermoanaerobaculia bacterium]
MRKRFCLLVIFLLAGCGQPTVDTSTDETTKASLKEVREALPENKRAELDSAVQTLAMSQLDLSEIFTTGEAPDAQDAEKNLKSMLQGKTGEEIISAADRVVAAQKAKERERAVKEIQELVKERDAATRAMAELAKFEVLRSRFYKERDYFGSFKPVIQLRVRNGTKHPISHAYFSGKITSPGRSVPWLEEEFNYPISGGLEPGEEAQWNLAPNQFSEWGTVDVPPDAGLTVTVTRLDGPNGEAILSTQEFTKEDQARLEALQKEYGQ